MTNESGAELVDVFCGGVSPAAAHIYLRGAEPLQGEMSGYLEGPFCEFAETLTSRAELRDLGPGEGRLAVATMCDPCAWTPLHPTVYHLHAQVRTSSGEQKISRRVGIRCFGVRGNDFLMDAKRWVLRGVRQARWTEADLLACRETLASVVVDENSLDADELIGLAEATTRLGVPLAVQLSGRPAEMRSMLRRLSWFPSVLLARLRSNEPLDETMDQVAPNICLVESLDQAGQTASPWSQAWWVECNSTTGGGQASIVELAGTNPGRPVMAIRRCDPDLSLAGKREHCDLLQRDLVGTIECSAYIV